MMLSECYFVACYGYWNWSIKTDKPFRAIRS